MVVSTYYFFLKLLHCTFYIFTWNGLAMYVVSKSPLKSVNTYNVIHSQISICLYRIQSLRYGNIQSLQFTTGHNRVKVFMKLHSKFSTTGHLQHVGFFYVESVGKILVKQYACRVQKIYI